MCLVDGMCVAECKSILSLLSSGYMLIGGRLNLHVSKKRKECGISNPRNDITAQNVFYVKKICIESVTLLLKRLNK